MVEKLTDQQIEQFNTAFRSCDYTGNGTIATTDLETVIKALGFNLTKAELAEVWIDGDKNEYIDFPEFLIIMNKILNDDKSSQARYSKLVGTVKVWTSYLLYNLETDKEEVSQEIKDTENKVAGWLSTKWTPLAGPNKEDEGKAIPDVDSEEDLLGKPWTYRLDIEKVTYNAEETIHSCTFISYEFLGQKYTSDLVQSNGDSFSGVINYSKVHHVPKATKDFMTFLNGSLNIEVYADTVEKSIVATGEAKTNAEEVSDHGSSILNGITKYYIEYLIYNMITEENEMQQDIKNSDDESIIGQLTINWIPLAGPNKEDESRKPEDIEEEGALLGKSWTCRLEIEKAVILGRLYQDVFITYEFFGEKFTSETTQSDATNNLVFNYSKVHHVPTVTKQFLDFLKEPIVIRITNSYESDSSDSKRIIKDTVHIKDIPEAFFNITELSSDLTTATAVNFCNENGFVSLYKIRKSIDPYCDVFVAYSIERMDATNRQIKDNLIRQLQSQRMKVFSPPIAYQEPAHSAHSKNIDNASCVLYLTNETSNNVPLNAQTMKDMNWLMKKRIPVIKVVINGKGGNVVKMLGSFPVAAVCSVSLSNINVQSIMSSIRQSVFYYISNVYDALDMSLPDSFQDTWSHEADADDTVNDNDDNGPISKEEEGKEKTKEKWEEQLLLAALSKGKKEWNRSKLMIVGEGRAGKTALANSIVGNHFSETSSTIGINQVTCDVKYTAVGTTSGDWESYTKPTKELEAALVSMITNEKLGRNVGTKGPVISSGNAAKTIFDDPDRIEDVVPLTAKTDDERTMKEHTKSNEQQEHTGMVKPPADARKPTASRPTVHKHIAGSNTETDKSTVTSDPTKHVSKPKQTQAIDNDLVMKCLANNMNTESKFILSIFDFGGQSVFNVIHPFFLTRFGVYVVVFNMEWILTPNELERSECLSYLTFWINSVIIHTLNDRNETAPIILVGTRGDKISSPADHEKISTILYQTFRSSIAWPYVLENTNTQGGNGTTDMFFFPVDNRQGRKDPNMMKLMKIIEERIDASDYVHEEKPLSWLQLLDQLTGTKESFLTYQQVETLAKSCEVDSVSIPLILHFFHQMGMLMWHDEDDLRDIIILNPIEYFVTPATLVICKHSPTTTDNTYHSLDVHKYCMKHHYYDWNKMIEKGVVSLTLFNALLSQYSPAQQETVKVLMIKYGLLVPLLSSLSSTTDTNDEAIRQTNKEEEIMNTSYLAPALLPETPPEIVGNDDTDWCDQRLGGHTFFFVFTASKQLENETTLTNEDLKQQGFLPSGLFERLICKAVSWSQQTTSSASSVEVFQLKKEQAVMCYGSQRFRMTLHMDYRCIQVDVEGTSPVAVHERLRGQLSIIIRECMKSLRFFTTVPYLFPGLVEKTTSTTSPVSTYISTALLLSEKTMLHIRLSQLLKAGNQHSALNLLAGGGRRSLLSSKDLQTQYHCWLQQNKILSHYDLFLSYRWNAHDSAFTQALFDRMTLYTVDTNHRAVDTFLDIHRLKEGRTFQREFVKALSSSLVVIPIISSTSLARMRDHNPEEEDNLLAEWILAMICYQSQQQSTNVRAVDGKNRVRKVIPILFGSIQSDGTIMNFFAEEHLQHLPDYHPTATMRLVRQIIQESNTVSLDDLSLPVRERWDSITVKEIVTQMSKFLCLMPWEYGQGQGHGPDGMKVIAVVGEHLVNSLTESIAEESLALLQTIHTAAAIPSSASSTTTAAAMHTVSSTLPQTSSILSIKELIDRIKAEFGIDTKNFAEVLEEAAGYMDPSVQTHLHTLSVLKEKALYIAEQAGVL